MMVMVVVVGFRFGWGDAGIGCKTYSIEGEESRVFARERKQGSLSLIDVLRVQ